MLDKGLLANLPVFLSKKYFTFLRQNFWWLLRKGMLQMLPYALFSTGEGVVFICKFTCSRLIGSPSTRLGPNRLRHVSTLQKDTLNSMSNF